MLIKMKIKYFFAVVLITFFSSCDIMKQASELTSFAKCKFKINTVENINLAGVNVLKIKDYSQLDFMDIARLTSALTSGNLPLNFTLNMKVNNPNQKQAAMNQFDWILLIDDIEMNRGVVNQRVEIPSGGDAILPLQMTMNLKEILKGETLKSLVNFGLNLADASGKSSRITIKAKPTIMIGGRAISYPDYITIKGDI